MFGDFVQGIMDLLKAGWADRVPKKAPGHEVYRKCISQSEGMEPILEEMRVVFDLYNKGKLTDEEFRSFVLSRKKVSDLVFQYQAVIYELVNSNLAAGLNILGLMEIEDNYEVSSVRRETPGEV